MLGPISSARLSLSMDSCLEKGLGSKKHLIYNGFSQSCPIYKHDRWQQNGKIRFYYLGGFDARFELIILGLKPSNTFEKYQASMHVPEQQSIFTEVGGSTFYIGAYKDYPHRATIKCQAL